MAQRVLQNICTGKQEAARAAQVRDAVATGDILAAVGAAMPEAAEEGEEEEAALPAWMEESDGRFSPPLEEAAAVGGAAVEEDDDRELLLLQRTQVGPACRAVAAADWPALGGRAGSLAVCGFCAAVWRAVGASRRVVGGACCEGSGAASTALGRG